MASQPGPHPEFPPPSRTRANGLGVASLVCGTVGLLLSPLPFVGLSIGIVALVLGLVARGRIKRGAAGSRGGVVAGIVLATAAVVVGGAVSILLVFVVVQQQNCVDRAHSRTELMKCD